MLAAQQQQQQQLLKQSPYNGERLSQNDSLSPSVVKNLFSSNSLAGKVHTLHATRSVQTSDTARQAAIDSKQWQFMKAINDKAGNNFIGAHIHINNQYVDEITPPHGNTMTFVEDTEFDPRFVSERLGAVVILVPILNSNRYSDNYFNERLRFLSVDGDGNEVLKNAHANAIDRDLLQSSDPVSGKDNRPWVATLGSHGNSLTIVKDERDRNDNQYFIRVQSDSQAAGVALRMVAMEKAHANAMKNLPFTIGDFYNSEEYNTVLNLSLRNAQRLAAEAADALGVKVVTYEDPWAKVLPYRAVPKLAKPQVVNYFSALKKAKIDDVHVIVVLNHVVDTNQAKGGVLYSADPTYPQRLYSKQSSTIGREISKFENHVFDTFPAFTGKVRDTISCEKVQSKLSPNVKSLIHSSITWDNKNPNEIDVNHPMLTTQCRQIKGNNISDESHKWNKEMLGAKYPFIDLKTVICKMAPPGS